MTSGASDRDVAVVTGAAGGIGLGIAKAALARGMRVMIADLDGDRAEQSAAELRADGGTIRATDCDVRRPASIESLRDATLEAFGRVDLVCNNAGVGFTRPITDATDADWRLVLDVNLNGVINGVRTFLPLLVEQGRGHISATASLSGLVADPDLSIYNTSKFAVVGLMEAIAVEMRRDHRGVTASVLCPGPVATDLMDSSATVLGDGGSRNADVDDAVVDYLARGLHPDEVGRLAIDGIAAGHFWLLPQPELTFELLDDRHAAMKSGQLASPADEWTDQ